MSVSVILVPTNQVGDLPREVFEIQVVILPGDNVKSAGLSDFPRDGQRHILVTIAGVPDKVDYTTTIEDLVQPEALEFMIDELARIFVATGVRFVYMPENGLAAVPMKNRERLEIAIQARVNAGIVERLEKTGQIADVYLSLTSSKFLLPLELASEIRVS